MYGKKLKVEKIVEIRNKIEMKWERKLFHMKKKSLLSKVCKFFDFLSAVKLKKM